MRIGVISDTHIPRKRKRIPDTVLQGIKGASLIIHAGDINEISIIRSLEKIAPVEAVAGNTDDVYVRKRLGIRKIISVEGKRIGIIHGDGKKGRTIDRVIEAFADEDVNCVVFGHSHIPVNRVINEVLYFNPGSPTDKRRQQYFSYGILEIGNSVTGEIIHFEQ